MNRSPPVPFFSFLDPLAQSQSTPQVAMRCFPPHVSFAGISPQALLNLPAAPSIAHAEPFLGEQMPYCPPLGPAEGVKLRCCAWKGDGDKREPRQI